MTKKHFIALAAALASQRAMMDDSAFRSLTWRIAHVCAAFNRQFDKDRFVRACNGDLKR